MKRQHISDDISLIPFKNDFKGYTWNALWQDMGAGLSVALLTIPQAMAYALVANLPLSCGLFAAIFSSMIAAIFGSSRHLIMGPSNSIAILVQAGTSEILFNYYRHVTGMERDVIAIQIMIQLTLLVGVIQLLFALFKLGRLTQFVSHSVIIGYLAGAVVAIVINQLFVFLGISEMPGLHSFYDKGRYLLTHLKAIHWPTAFIGLASMFFLIIFRRINKKVPAAAMTFGITSIMVYMMGMSSFSIHLSLSSPVSVVGNTGDVYGSFLVFSPPFLNMKVMSALLPVAFAVALLGILESVSVSKAMAANSGQRLSINQEIFGLGLGNITSSLIAAMPISGNSSRSALNYQSGASTRLAAVLSSFFLAMLLFVFGFIITHIPLASLAALMLISSVRALNMRHLLLCLKATSSDALVFWVTFLSCVFFSLDVAFYFGVILSITFYLKKAAEPQLVEYAIDSGWKLKSISLNESKEDRTIRIIKVKGELFFGAADLFQSTLKTLAKDRATTKVIILELNYARDLDATTCLALQHLNDYLKGSGRHLICCGLTLQTWDVLSDAGMVQELGRENLFLYDEKHSHISMQKAIEHAQELIRIDDEKKAMIQEAENSQIPAQLFEQAIASSKSQILAKEQS